MKSAIIINSLSRGGAEKVVSILWDYKLSNDENLDLYLLKDEVSYSATTRYKVLRLDKDIFFPLKLIKAINSLLKSKYNIIQSHLDVPNILNCISKIIGGKHSCQIVHCVAYSNSSANSGFLAKVKISSLDYIFKYADLHIFKSEDMYKDYLAFFKNRPKKYKIIHNPYDFVSMDTQANETIITAKKTNRIKFLIVCRLTKHKSVDVALKALSLSDIDYEVNVLGEGPELLRLKNLSVELGIADKISFLGFKKNPYVYYKEADYYLSASQAEGFPNTLVEAMYFGCIPIHSNCISGPRELIGHNSDSIDSFVNAKYGYLFNVGDYKGMYEAIKASCSKQDYLCDKYQASISNSVKKYSVSEISTQYYKVIKDDF
ncbi:glycosyltransferase [Cobetia sp. 10Alg 146]|uniref:glycosyltransferase n=1 Tax=Cobetia sp. 10Alg 146 TaxID=3040019 RepID=UPI00244828DC|nr:glycosyltransferase [Cobetia sp. 10Alg 146]MDH2292317.1 glycosyltransferase [Cobetia sp. 10Alg 146]